MNCKLDSVKGTSSLVWITPKLLAAMLKSPLQRRISSFFFIWVDEDQHSVPPPLLFLRMSKRKVHCIVMTLWTEWRRITFLYSILLFTWARVPNAEHKNKFNGHFWCTQWKSLRKDIFNGGRRKKQNALPYPRRNKTTSFDLRESKFIIRKLIYFDIVKSGGAVKFTWIIQMW